MKFLEQDLEDLIWNACKTREGLDLLGERNFPIWYGKMYRQFDFGGYGIADLINVRIENNIDPSYPTRIVIIDVYELKKDHIGFEALGQACRYAKACKLLFKDLKEQIKGRCKLEVNIFLIGKTIDLKTDFCYVLEMFPFKIFASTYSFDAFQGLTFQDHSRFEPRSNAKRNSFTPSMDEIRDMVEFKVIESFEMRTYNQSRAVKI